jgi:hypothetical protein
LVSTREFESGIEQSLINLQKTLNSPIAVYPISSPLPLPEILIVSLLAQSRPMVRGMTYAR